MSITTHFQDTFPSLSKFKKSIWRTLAGLSRNCAKVFPSHAYLAEQAKCSRKTVVRAISEFKENGWLAAIQDRKTCNYFLHSDILESKECFKIWVDNGAKNVPFARKNVPGASTRKTPQNVPHTKEPLLLSETLEDVPKKEPKKRLRQVNILPQFVKDLPIDDQAKRYLSRFSDQVLSEAYTDYTFYTKKHIPDNPSALFISRAQAHFYRSTMIMTQGETLKAPVKTTQTAQAAPVDTPAKAPVPKTPREKIEQAIAKEAPNMPAIAKVQFYNSYVEIGLKGANSAQAFNYSDGYGALMTYLNKITNKRAYP